MALRSVPRTVSSLLLPPVCLVCGQQAREALDCCRACELELPRLRSGCRRCAVEMAHAAEFCGRCQRRMPAWDRAWSGFAYRGVVESLVRRFKFHHDLAAGRMLAGVLAARLVALGAPRPQLMVPVPLHWRRRLVRGFNQSEMLCRDLAGWLEGPPWYPLLGRRRHTSSQSALPAARRTGNVRGAFRVRRAFPGLRHVVLVDDVMTTGSTVNECARVLRRAGVERVDVWVIARA